MSDRYLRTLLRQAQQGQVALTDYVAAALRVSPPEVVIADLQGFSIDDIRLAIRLVWIPAYAARDKHTKARVALAGVLGDPIAKRVAPANKKNTFPTLPFVIRNYSLLTDADWRLFAADCAEHVLHLFESAYPDDNRPRRAIETARRFAKGEATVQELYDAHEEARQVLTFHSLRSVGVKSRTTLGVLGACRSALASASTDRDGTAAGAVSSVAERTAMTVAEDAAIPSTKAEVKRQRARLAARLSDYLVDLSALPWPA